MNALGEGLTTQVDGSDLTLAKAVAPNIINIGAVVLVV